MSKNGGNINSIKEAAKDMIRDLVRRPGDHAIWKEQRIKKPPNLFNRMDICLHLKTIQKLKNMIMNATNQQDSSCKKTVRPAGVEIKKVQVTSLGFQINFPNPRHDKPLPTIAEVAINENNEMEISIVVFLSKNTEISPDDLCVIQDFSYTNNKVPYANFYVCYDVTPKPSSVFNVFQLTFNAINSPEGYTPNATLPVMPDPNILDSKEIVSFLWDEDPVGSRGTVTTVKSA